MPVVSTALRFGLSKHLAYIANLTNLVAYIAKHCIEC